jgi:biotin synthase
MKIYLCAISNLISGYCKEDCGFCVQSQKHNIPIKKYFKKDISIVVEEAKKAKKNKACGFCLVTSGKKLTKNVLKYLCDTAEAIKREVDGLKLIGCNGIAKKEDLVKLKENGFDAYNHNLETSKGFYHNLCTTHKWEERFKTCLATKEAGLELYCGGIFGVGENWKVREDFIKELLLLSPYLIPINFFHPHPSLPIRTRFDKKDALRLVSAFREFFPLSNIMIAGGREYYFKDDWIDLISAGANSIVIGDYLTTKGEKPSADISILKENGYEIP